MANEVGQGRGQEAIASELAMECFRLRCRGFTYREIGKEKDISHVAAFRHVQNVIEENHKQTQELGRKFVEVELERLDKMAKSIEEKANDGDISAQEMMLKIQHRRAKYLGLDAPEKKELEAGEGLKDLILKSMHPEDAKEKKEAEET